eukprot:12922395-Prorocentrum_lima.AAC.1
MGFGDAALVLQTCEQRLTGWIALLKEAVKNGLEKQTACQLLSWVGSSLAVHAVRTTLQNRAALETYDAEIRKGWDWLAGTTMPDDKWLLATLPRKMGGLG